MKCQNRYLQAVNEAGFVLDDANLFLDTHPCCENALHYYHEAAERYREAKKAYTKACGPLYKLDSDGDCYHDWVKDPWPWEGGNC